MKSWFFKNNAHGLHFELREADSPEPKSNEILVKVHAAGLNRGEFLPHALFKADSEYKACGIECAGEVINVGDKVRNFGLGDRIMGRSKMAFSENAIILEGNALSVPSHFSWEEAACTSITYQTAHDMLWANGRLQNNEWLLVTGISSGVGLAALQLGKLIGAKIIGTSRSAPKLERIKKYGLDYGLTFPRETFEKQVFEITNGHGIDLLINNIGGSAFEDCVRILAYRGRLATVGLVDGSHLGKFDLTLQHLKRLTFFGVSNKLRSNDEIFAQVNQFKKDVYPYICNGRLVPIIDKVYDFQDFPEAVKHMNSNSHFGKIAIKY